MKTLAVAAVALLLSAASLAASVRPDGAAPGEWTHDIDAAREMAKREGRYLFLNFTGSDWCCWCKHMEAKVFSKSAWTDFAAKNLSLGFVDSPGDPNLVPEKYRARNRRLVKDEKVRGFPTFIVYSPDGRRVGTLGASRDATEYGFITNVVALVAEDRMAELVSPDELKDYRAAVAERAAWEGTNEAAQAAFRRDFAQPHQKAMEEIDREKTEVLRKAAARLRAETKPNAFAKGCEIRFSDFGRGVATNGAAFGAWTADFGAARDLAMKSGRDLLVAFVGPDWCDWGNQMESNVFNTAEWMNFAKDHFVQVYIDCPNDDGTSRLPEWLVSRNAKIYNHYQMRGCPFYLLTDGEGNRYDAFGATTGITPKEQIAAVEMRLARHRISEFATKEEGERLKAAEERERREQAKWRREYDAFIAEMEAQSESFAPVAERRNRILKKALKALAEGRNRPLVF